MIEAIRNFLYEPIVREMHVDDNALLDIHRKILLRKRLLRSAFEYFYRDMVQMCDSHFSASGIEVELGTGAGFFKEVRPQLVTSDVRRGAHIELVLDAQNMMPLEDASVRCIYAINVFHHLPRPVLFFDELVRVLKPGAGCILIEPHNGPMSRWLHANLHKDERFDASAPGWENEVIAGPLSGANQALAHIVFDRDDEQFSKLYGDELEIVEKRYELNALRYLFSGGLNFKQLLPSVTERPLAWIENKMRPLARYWSLHRAVVLRRR